MVQIAGYIVFPSIDERDWGEANLRTTSAEVLIEIRRLLEPQFPNLYAIIQNACHGIAFFNFSNHAGNRRNTLEQCAAYLQKLRTGGFHVEWHMDFQDEETGDYLVLKPERN